MASSSSLTRSWLTDDILIEIFTYLPLNSIYKFKCLSKVWLSNLSNPNFLIKWYQINHKSLPWILYYTFIGKDDGRRLKCKKAYPDLHSGFMSRNQHLFSFQFLMNQELFQGADDVFMLGFSNGLALCISLHLDDQCRRRYHVCNPLTQKWVSLPSPPPDSKPRRNRFDVGGISCDYSSSFTSCFKVVCIPKFDTPSKKFNVDVFSSDLGVWESFDVSCDENIVWEAFNFDKVVVVNGALFWIQGGDRMLVYNLNQKNTSDGHRCSLINLPDMEFGDDEFGIFRSCIGESEGRVCYAKTRTTEREMTVSVWVLNEFNWQILHKGISVGSIFTELCSRIGEVAVIQVLGFCPVDRNVVLLGHRHWVWRFNVQTRSLEELCLDNRHVGYLDAMFLPFVVKPMPTVLPPTSWIDT